MASISVEDVHDDLAAALLKKYQLETLQPGDVTAQMLADRDEAKRTSKFWQVKLSEEAAAGHLRVVDVMLPNGRRGKAYRKPEK